MATAKSAKETSAAEVQETAANLFTEGLSRIVSAQKNVLDLAAHQNAEAVASCKKALSLAPPVPGTFLVDLAGQAFEKCIDAQKGMLDLMAKQSAAIADAGKLRGESLSKAAATVATLLRQSVEQGIVAQKNALGIAAQQSNAVADTVRRQLSGTPVARAVESVQHSVDVLIETQTELLDIASKSLKAAAAKA